MEELEELEETAVAAIYFFVVFMGRDSYSSYFAAVIPGLIEFEC